MSSERPRAGKIGEENEVAAGEEEEGGGEGEGKGKGEEEGGKRRLLPASQAGGCGSVAGTVTGNRAPSPSFQTSSAKAKSGGAGRGDAGISNGDWPRVNGALNMTVSGTENSGSYDDGTAAATVAEGSPTSTEVAVAISASAKAPSSASSSEEDDGDTPMNLSPEGGGDKDEDEAMNLCPPPAPLPTEVRKEREAVKTTTTFGMCAKMRLKKQRLEAFAAQEEQMKAAAAAAANAKNLARSDNGETTNGNAAAVAGAPVAVTPASASGFACSAAHENDQTSALHRLAEAAQRKQVRPTPRWTRCERALHAFDSYSLLLTWWD